MSNLQEIGKRPYIHDFKVVQVRRGSELLWTKTDYTQTTWRTYDIVKSNVDVLHAPFEMKTKPRGVNKSKVDRLCANLLPLVPAHKRAFWQDLQRTGSSNVRDING